MSLDGTNLQDVLTTGPGVDGIAIALDAASEKIYWTEWTAQAIRRANLDGTKAKADTAGAPALGETSLQQWIVEAKRHNVDDEILKKGIAVLEQFLGAMRPRETALLSNYPNPFNPETWIPYQLAESTDVSISVYSADGQLVRTLALGHQPVGLYESRSRAAYWDGRNTLGESVASGVYFYRMTSARLG